MEKGLYKWTMSTFSGSFGGWVGCSFSPGLLLWEKEAEEFTSVCGGVFFILVLILVGEEVEASAKGCRFLTCVITKKEH